MGPMGSLLARKVVPLLRRGRHERHAAWRGAVAGLDARVADIERRFAAFDRRYAALDMSSRMQAAVLVSILIHAIVMFGITFKMPDPSQFSNLAQPLEVVLVNAKSATKPLKADALAQHHLEGGGNTDADRRAKSPLPVTREDQQAAELSAAAKRVEQLERESRQLMTQAKAKAKVEAAPPQPEPQPQSDVRSLPNAADLMQRSLEIARLEAQISKDWNEYQKRPRRRFVGARTQEFRFARYIEDWRLKVERVGELNYPQAARDQKLYGTLVVTVSIKADGALDKIEINRPSGHRVLDEAALRIVRLSAPFAAFSADIAKDTDILSITRTWTFTRSDQLVTE